MKKIGISGILLGILALQPFGADAAYPVYQNYQPVGMPQNQIVYLPTNTNSTIIANRAVAVQPTRVTGALPRVGSNATAAGRRYYQPADYDRLADSGLYVGISAGYTASIMGGISADYQGDSKSYFAPGSFSEAEYKKDTIIPLQLSVGAAINSDVRVDFSYLRYSGFSYPDVVQTSDGYGLISATADGGAITSNTAMLNVYYNIDSFTGYMAGGTLRPYIGLGVGIAMNSIADYVVYDNGFYPEVDNPENYAAGTLTAVSDIYAYHNGGTNEQLAFMLEGGVSTDVGNGMKFDFFVRYANLGKVQTSGSIVVSQTGWLATGNIMTPDGQYEYPADYDSVFHYTNWYESGRLGMIDVGARLRLQF